MGFNVIICRDGAYHHQRFPHKTFVDWLLFWGEGLRGVRKGVSRMLTAIYVGRSVHFRFASLFTDGFPLHGESLLIF